MPESLIFLRRTMVSGPGPLLSTGRAGYFWWKLGGFFVFVGGIQVTFVVFKWKLGAFLVF